MGTVIEEACSWKGQLEKTWSWKVSNEIGKNEAGKLEPKLETTFQVGKSLKLKINFKRNFPTSDFPTPQSFHLQVSLFLDLISKCSVSASRWARFKISDKQENRKTL